MAYKLGLLLSSVYLMLVLMLGGDLYCVFTLRSKLDSLATVVTYRITMNGCLDDTTRQLVRKEGAEIHLLNDITPRVGDLFTVEVWKSYQPLIMQKTPITVTVRRSAVVGFYETK